MAPVSFETDINGQIETLVRTATEKDTRMTRRMVTCTKHKAP
jgi:hypothetical protein